VESVREIEQRIQGVEARGVHDVDLPDRPIDIPPTFEEHIKLMYDLQALAFQADVTRVFTMLVCKELSGRTYSNIGVPEGVHVCSHHRDDPDLIAKKAKIDAYHIELLAYFLQKLQGIQDGDGTLLDHSLILYGGGMGDGNLHRHNNLPTLTAGKLGGRFETGRHIAYKLDTPMSNLLVAILDKAGVNCDKIGDSTGPLEV
jgi:hypothetical protein